MKPVVMALLMTVAVNVFFASHVGAVGLYAVGKEQISCSPLVARGIVPDTWNKLSEAFLAPQISWALDRLAVEMKSLLNQFGAPPAPPAIAETASVTKDDLVSANDRSKQKPREVVQEKPAKQIKKAEVKKDKKDIKKPADKPKKRIKVPPKAM